MRKVIYGGFAASTACSPIGSAVDWLHFSKDVEAIVRVSWASADTMLLGRTNGPRRRRDLTTLGHRRHELRVLAHAHLDSRQESQLITSDAGGFVKLKAAPGKDIIVMSQRQLRPRSRPASSTRSVSTFIRCCSGQDRRPSWIPAGGSNSS
jgi:hypothetical protein